jgi:hypothetical protein
MHKRSQGCVDIELATAECPDISNGRGSWIAIHNVGGAALLQTSGLDG